MDLSEIVAMNLKEIMNIKRVGISELSTMTKISRNTITNLRSGRTKMIQFQTIEKISKALNIDSYQLFEMNNFIVGRIEMKNKLGGYNE